MPEVTARILVIDDDPQIVNLLQQTLEAGRYEVAGAYDGNRGLKLFRDNPVDLVIVDLIMPEKEGMETIQELRGDFPETKIIVISGGGRMRPDPLLSAAQSLGADRAFSKPFYPHEVLRTVRELLADRLEVPSGPKHR